MRSACLLGLSIVLLLGGAVGANAEERAAIGDDFLISGPAALESESEPAIAFDPTRYQYLVVWVDKRHDDDGDIYGRLLDAGGAPLGGDFRISRGADWGDQLTPAVAYNAGADEYLVVWEDWRNVPLLRGADIYGKRVSPDGDPQGVDTRISGPNAVLHDWQPAVAAGPDGAGYLVVWMDRRAEAGHGTDIYGRRVGEDGKPTGKDRRISGQAAIGDEWWPSVAYNSADGEFMVVWSDTRAAAARVYGRRVAPDLTFPAREFRVSGGAAEVHLFADLAHDPDLNQYLVAWQDKRNFDTAGYDIYAVRLDAAGERQGRDRPLSKTPEYEYRPVVAYQTVNDRFLIVWSAWNPLSDDMYLKGRGLTNAGLFAGAPFPIVTNGPFHSARHALAYGAGAGRCLAVWVDGREAATRLADIYGRFAKG